MTGRRSSVLSLALLVAAAALPARADGPVVHAVLFYSPTCPHCHRLITTGLPPIQARYGERLQIAFLDVTSPRGGAAWAATIVEYGITREHQGVPTMIVGQEVLNGEEEIPARLPALVDRLLASGGAPPPRLGPDLLLPPPATAPPPTAAAGFPRLPRGAGSTAILGVLLAALVLQVGHAAVTWRRRPGVRAGRRRWLTLALIMASLGVALYLARAELRGGHVLCLSDCDAVHSSEWAWLFGVVPVGALGAAGALGLLVAWVVARHRDARVAAWAGAAFLAMSLVGVVVSIYLTFLELFVIGAMCEWCVANAVLMMAIAGLNLAPGKRALDVAMG